MNHPQMDIGHDLLAQEWRAPMDVLHQLTAVHPWATLLGTAENEWTLGTVTPVWVDSEARRVRYLKGLKGMRRLTMLPPSERSRHLVLRAQLLMRGFQLVRVFHGEPNGRIVRALEEHWWRYRYDWRTIERAMNSAKKEEDRLARQAKEHREYTEAVAPDLFNYHLKGRRSFTAAATH